MTHYPASDLRAVPCLLMRGRIGRQIGLEEERAARGSAAHQQAGDGAQIGGRVVGHGGARKVLSRCASIGGAGRHVVALCPVSGSNLLIGARSPLL